MKNKNIIPELTSLQQIILTDPDQRYILWIISNDPKTFSSYFFMEIAKRPDLLQPNASPNLLKALTIYHNLLKKKMIDTSNPLKTKITWRGQFYRLYTHSSFQLWAAIAAIIFGMGIIKFSCGNSANDVSNSKESETKKEKVQNVLPSVDTTHSIPYEKEDSVSLHRSNSNL